MDKTRGWRVLLLIFRYCGICRFVMVIFHAVLSEKRQIRREGSGSFLPGEVRLLEPGKAMYGQQLFLQVLRIPSSRLLSGRRDPDQGQCTQEGQEVLRYTPIAISVTSIRGCPTSWRKRFVPRGGNSRPACWDPIVRRLPL